MFFYDEDVIKSKHCISPQKYFPPTKLLENKRFSNITFPKSPRMSDDKNSKIYIFICKIKINLENIIFPGPGAYNLPSVFDSKRKYKVPIN
jgi:hypothetical protein